MNKEDVKEMVENNELLKKQLHSIQEEYEYLYVTSKSNQENKKLSLEIDKLKRELDKKNKELNAIGYKLEIAEKNINKYKDNFFGKLNSSFQIIGRKKFSDQPNVEDVAALLMSDYFDSSWYLNKYPDVKESGMNPAIHYIVYGFLENRIPSRNFDAEWYLSEYQDVRESKMNPLLHYIKHGESEGRLASKKQVKKS